MYKSNPCPINPPTYPAPVDVILPVLVHLTTIPFANKPTNPPTKLPEVDIVPVLLHEV